MPDVKRPLENAVYWLIAHAKPGACGVDAFAEHQAAGLLQPYLLLELQGAHRGDRLDVVKARDTHTELTRDLLDLERLVAVLQQRFFAFYPLLNISNLILYGRLKA